MKSVRVFRSRTLASHSHTHTSQVEQYYRTMPTFESSDASLLRVMAAELGKERSPLQNNILAALRRTRSLRARPADLPG